MKLAKATPFSFLERPNLLPSAVYRWLLSRVSPRVTHGQLHLQLPEGKTVVLGKNPGPQAFVQLHSYAPLKRLMFGGLTGWAESYMAGEWDSRDITGLIAWAAENEPSLNPLTQLNGLKQWSDNLFHRKNANSREGSQKNISFHYDLGNDFYRLWLDDTMTYSAALFDEKTQGTHDRSPNLVAAQHAKNARILELMELKGKDKVLEIGCGWGGFMRQCAATTDASIEGITLSHEQLAYAQEKIHQLGLDERCHAMHKDYRDLDKTYDAIASIEMFEAVGEENWKSYFDTVKRSLKADGSAVLQVITIDESRFDTYRETADFIQRYIFPGGMLPSIPAFKAAAEKSGLELVHYELFGQDYATTLKLWRQRFEEVWPSIEAQGFDERFRRLWRYYLCYCEGGFLSGSINVGLYKLKHQSA
ncbi:MAG: class I SAM-dependent methyltransferase [Pontibacterium sp.]